MSREAFRMAASRVAAQRVYALALRCDPIPEALAGAAREYIDAHELVDPFNSRMTLDGRPRPHDWRRPVSELAAWPL